MKKLLCAIIWQLPFIVLQAQNVGVGTTTPSEKLDVNGNINLTGTVKINGVDGTQGQVLMKNSAGVFSWGNLLDYPNVVGFKALSATTTSSTNYSWYVPAGITKLFVECWGGGGGGASGGGGGGGGYSACTWTVASGALVTINVAQGGSGATASGSDAGAGGTSSVNIGTLQMGADGGSGGHAATGGLPGRFYASSLLLYTLGLSGAVGEANLETYGQYSATVFYTAIKFGNSGQCANTPIEQHNSGFRSFNTATNATIKYIAATVGSEPGGGGGGDYIGGKQGGPGLVVIHY